MDKTVPKPAAFLLDFIAGKEAPKGYDTVYANRMDRMPKPLTSMTMKEVLDQGRWRSNTFGSSACGRYQFMDATLRDLAAEMGLKATDKFTSDYQDRLGFQLLRRRGYDKWINGMLSDGEFMLNISKEWASFPVPFQTKGRHRTVLRGQSFYTGDNLNKVLITAEAVEKALLVARAQIERGESPVVVAPPEPPLDTREVPVDAIPTGLWQAIRAAVAAYFTKAA